MGSRPRRDWPVTRHHCNSKAQRFPLHNLELFPQSPSLTLAHFEAIGRNAAAYAKGERPTPVGVKVDNWARLRLIVKTALLHRHETAQIEDKPPMNCSLIGSRKCRGVGVVE
ncbi:MAG: hypothetical protein R2911_39810 [Caldilineaceae bacterium]